MKNASKSASLVQQVLAESRTRVQQANKNPRQRRGSLRENFNRRPPAEEGEDVPHEDLAPTGDDADGLVPEADGGESAGNDRLEELAQSVNELDVVSLSSFFKLLSEKIGADTEPTNFSNDVVKEHLAAIVEELDKAEGA